MDSEELPIKKKFEKVISFVGLPRAGKTTLLHAIRGEYNIETTRTMGMDIEKMAFGDSNIVTYDLGGQEAFAETFWEPFVKVSNGVIFVFDSADPDCVELAGFWLDKVLDWTKEEAILCFFANKKDLPDSMSMPQIFEVMQLSNIIVRKPLGFQVFHVSALTGEGVDKAWAWFLSRIYTSEELRSILGSTI